MGVWAIMQLCESEDKADNIVGFRLYEDTSGAYMNMVLERIKYAISKGLDVKNIEFGEELQYRGVDCDLDSLPLREWKSTSDMSYKECVGACIVLEQYGGAVKIITQYSGVNWVSIEDIEKSRMVIYFACRYHLEHYLRGQFKCEFEPTSFYNRVPELDYKEYRDEFNELNELCSWTCGSVANGSIVEGELCPNRNVLVHENVREIPKWFIDSQALLGVLNKDLIIDTDGHSVKIGSELGTEGIDIPEGVISVTFDFEERGRLGSCRNPINVTLPVSCKQIGAYCGKHNHLHPKNRGLRNINLDGVEIIMTEALEGSRVQRFIANSKLVKLGAHAFRNCTELEYVDLSSTKIDAIVFGTFEDCNKLTTVKLNEYCDKIGSCAFENCSRLSEINLGNIKVIASSAFSNCNIKVADLSSAEKIEGAAFNGCDKLTNIKLSSRVKYIPGSAFFGCKLLKLEKNALINIEQFYPEAFAICKNLTELNLESAIRVDSKAFRNSGVKKVYFGEKLRILDATAFDGCGDITIYVPDTAPISETTLKNNVGIHYEEFLAGKYKIYRGDNLIRG